MNSGQTGGALQSVRRDFFFRNRRWFLAFLVAIGCLFLPLSPVSSGVRMARLLFRFAGGSSPEFWEHGLYGLGAALIVIGAFWRTWGSAYLGAHVVQDRQLHTERLVAGGPYRRTRNPLYFGNLLLTLGLAIVVNPMSGAIFVMGMWVLVRLFIHDEEMGLAESLGESYMAYHAAVPRLFPAWRAKIPAAGARPRWIQGFCGESTLWLLGVFAIGLAVTLNPRWYGRNLLWGIIIALLLFVWAKRRSRRQEQQASA